MSEDPVSRLHSPLVAPWLILTACGFLGAGALAVDAPFGMATYLVSAVLIAASVGSAYLLVRFLDDTPSRR